MSPEKMVHMANQIAIFFKSQPGDDHVERVAGHLSDFWEPRMRNQLLQYISDGGDKLDGLVLEAAKMLRKS